MIERDETAYSEINDPELLAEIRYATYSTTHDISPAWIGPHLPKTMVEEEAAIAGWAQAHYHFTLSFLEFAPSPLTSVLDLGCGHGQRTAMLARYAVAVIGLDMAERNIEFAREYNDHANILWRHGRWPCAVEPLSAIWCIEVLEHISRMQQAFFIQSALDSLQPDGRLFITTPASDIVMQPPHIGSLTPDYFPEFCERWKDRILHQDWLDNSRPDFGSLTCDPRSTTPASHYRLVMG